MMVSELYELSKNAVLSMDSDAALSIYQSSLLSGDCSAADAVRGIRDGLIEAAEKLDSGIITMAQMSASCIVAETSMRTLSPYCDGISHPKIILATIQGDRHSQGKDLIHLELSGLGFDVIDLGSDVPVDTIVSECIGQKAQAVVTSVIMSTSMQNEMLLEEKLRETGIRDSIITCIGGPPTTQAWADRIGADIWTRNSSECMKRLLESFPCML